ncbi:preprotein translocase subunit SecE [Buchnera aphidicola]|uniref:preprotein translocase subunit SecE n=1 Tax=Buchnera aphidicola TaxID=9 RepID=UPI0031B73A8D
MNFKNIHKFYVKNLEKIKWILMIFLKSILILEIFFLKYHFKKILKILYIVITNIIIIKIFFSTKFFKKIILLIYEIHTETHHITWPKKINTLKTTFIILLIILLISIILWILDNLCIRIISFFIPTQL